MTHVCTSDPCPGFGVNFLSTTGHTRAAPFKAVAELKPLKSLWSCVQEQEKRFSKHGHRSEWWAALWRRYLGAHYRPVWVHFHVLLRGFRGQVRGDRGEQRRVSVAMQTQGNDAVICRLRIQWCERESERSTCRFTRASLISSEVWGLLSVLLKHFCGKYVVLEKDVYNNDQS